MKHLVLVMIVGVLVGCGKEDPVQPNMPNPKASQPTTPNSYTANTNTTKPKPAKAKVIVGGKLWEFETGDYVSSSPAIGSDGTVYVGLNDTKLYAIKTDSKGPAKSPWPMFGQNAQRTGRVIK